MTWPSWRKPFANSWALCKAANGCRSCRYLGLDLLFHCPLSPFCPPSQLLRSYLLPSITRIGNRTFRKFWVGSEQSLSSRCKNFRRSSALYLLSPRFISALVTVEWWRPIVKSGRGVLTAPSCLDWNKATGDGAVDGGIDDCDASGVGIDRSPCVCLLGRSTILSAACTWPKAFGSQTSCWKSGLRLGFQSDQD